MGISVFVSSPVLDAHAVVGDQNIDTEGIIWLRNVGRASFGCADSRRLATQSLSVRKHEVRRPGRHDPRGLTHDLSCGLALAHEVESDRAHRSQSRAAQPAGLQFLGISNPRVAPVTRLQLRSCSMAHVRRVLQRASTLRFAVSLHFQNGVTRPAHKLCEPSNPRTMILAAPWLHLEPSKERIVSSCLEPRPTNWHQGQGARSQASHDAQWDHNYPRVRQGSTKELPTRQTLGHPEPLEAQVRARRWSAARHIRALQAATTYQGYSKHVLCKAPAIVTSCGLVAWPPLSMHGFHGCSAHQVMTRDGPSRSRRCTCSGRAVPESRGSIQAAGFVTCRLSTAGSCCHTACHNALLLADRERPSVRLATYLWQADA